MTSEELYEWMSENGIKTKEMAMMLGVLPRSLSAYKSQGLPKSKALIAKKVTKEWEQLKKDSIPEELEISLVLTSERELSWRKANLIKGEKLTNYAISRLDFIASIAQRGY